MVEPIRRWKEVVVAGVFQAGSGVMIPIQEVDGELAIPILTGPMEAQLIYCKLVGESFPRPMSCDLMRSLILAMGGHLKAVYITKMVEDTFFGEVEIETNGQLKQIDCRPSDAIALALAYGNVPIFAAAELFEDERIQTINIAGALPGSRRNASQQSSHVHSQTKPRPAATPSDEDDELHKLRQELRRAEEDERYEDAAVIRDSIKSLEQKFAGRQNQDD